MPVSPSGAELDATFHAIAQGIPTLVFVNSSDGRNGFVNRAFCEFSGREPEGLLEHRWLDLVESRNLERASAAWQAAVADGRTFESEYRFRRHDGVWRWHVVRSVPQRDASGTVVQWIGSATDISELKEASERLHASDERLRLTLGALETGLWTWNVCTGLVTWSPEVYRILGVAPDEVKATIDTFFERIHPDDRARRSERARGDRVTQALRLRVPDPATDGRGGLGQPPRACDSNIVASVRASNGIVHVIDGVLLPPPSP